MRIGYGYDSHRFAEGRRLVLGGVEIPGARGLAGHSDADVLVHAVIDALLGAAARGDIGSHFPDNDPAWAGADSARLLARVVRELAEVGFRVGNVDATVICETPKLRPHVEAIRRRLADLLEVEVGRVSVKGKTNEKMDDVGAGLGIEVHCVALLESIVPAGQSPLDLDELNRLYGAYVDTYRVAGGLPTMMALKRLHTAKVVENAKLIAAGEGFDARTTCVCAAAALLHDTGRYEQLRRFNTFRDSESVDHAVFSHDIVVAKGWLAACEPVLRSAILDAVLFHNRRDLPEGLDPLTLAAAQTVRDADKLDIFRVLEHQVETTDWRTDCRAFWNLPTTARPNPAVVEAIRAGRPVDYQNIRSLADFVLIQVGWMASGLAYATSRHLCLARGHLEFRRKFLHQLTDDPAVDALCDFARLALQKLF